MSSSCSSSSLWVWEEGRTGRASPAQSFLFHIREQNFSDENLRIGIFHLWLHCGSFPEGMRIYLPKAGVEEGSSGEDGEKGGRTRTGDIVPPHTTPPLREKDLEGHTPGSPPVHIWWLGGKESACQCKRLRNFGFDPWIGEAPTSSEAAKPMLHNCWGSRAGEPDCWAPAPQSPCSATREATAVRSRNTLTRGWPLLATTRESPQAAVKTQWSQK